MKNLNKVKIIFLDLDGTIIYSPTKGLLPSTIDALRKLKYNGYKLFVNTSRSSKETCMLPKELNEFIDGYSYAAGSYIVLDGNVIVNECIEAKKIKPVIDYLEDKKMTYRYVTMDQECYLNCHDESKEAIFRYLYDYVPAVKSYENEDINHLLFYYDDENDLINIKERCKDVELVPIKACAEIQNKGVSKSEAISKICAHYGFTDEETCAIGDGENDIPMLEKAYISIAMGNAREDVKKHATYVAKDIKDDGFKLILEEMGWINVN